jgi:LysM repeat protein
MLFRKPKSAQRPEIRRLLPRKKLHARAAASHEEIDDYEGESEPSMKLSQAFLVVLVLHVIAVGGIYGFSKFKEHTTPKVAAKTEAAPKKEATETIKAPVAAQDAKTNAAPQTYTVMAGDTLKRIATKFNTSIESIEKANNLAPNAVLKVGQVLTIGKTAAKPATEPVKAAPVAVTEKAAPAPAPAVVAKAPPLKAPEADKAVSTKVPAKTDAPAVTEPAKDTAYIVEKGDTPYSIAKKLKVSETALMKANNIDDPRKLKIGMKLTLP